MVALSGVWGLVPMRPFNWNTEPEEPDCHYELSLTYEQRNDLLRLIAHEAPRVSIAKRNYLVALLKNATKHDGPPLPDAALPWASLSAEARRQGVSEVDVLWDWRSPRERT